MMKSSRTWISIHAPREGGDILITGPVIQTITFQSTPPARGATTSGARHTAHDNISIHAPREGGDYVFAPGSP